MIVKCTNLGISYGEEVVIQDVNLGIIAGTLLPFVGPNGGGKTSLLKSFLGLVNLSSGAVHTQLGGRPPGYVPQQKGLDPIYPVSMRQIVNMGLFNELGWWRKPSPLHNRRIDEILDRLNLTNQQHKTYAELSGGMRQKTLIARALVGQPKLLILDEPTAGLDAATEREVLKMLFTLNRQEGVTILMAHHRLEDLSHLAKEVCLVDRRQATIIPATEAWTKLHASVWSD